MATINNDKVRYQKKIRPRQTVWNYMRRNRQFRVGDIMMICEISQGYLQNFTKSLERAGYIKHENSYKPYSNRRYTLLKNTGPIAPSATKFGLYDNNTQESFEFRESKEEQKVYAPDLLVSILKAVEDEMTKKELSNKVNTTKLGLNKWWERLKKIGVLLGTAEPTNKPKRFKNRSYYTMKYKRRDNHVLYKFDVNRAKEVLQELDNGAYKVHNKEMKQLWIH